MTFPIVIRLNKPMDARGWIGLGVYALVILLFAMMWQDRTLLKDDFFKTLATLIIGTGFINGPVGWAYQATKGGSEAAESSARIAEGAAKAALGLSAEEDEKPKPVVVTNDKDQPVPVEQNQGEDT